MAHSTSSNPLPLPTWLLAMGSVFIVGHLGIMGVSVLAAPSGPWPNPNLEMLPGPSFVMGIDEVTRAKYLRPLKMTHNYHFMTNRPGMPGVWLEVKLRSDTGAVVETLRLPDPAANPWVRHRQELLARHLLDGDRPMQAPAGEVIPAPGQRVQEVRIWEMGMDRVHFLRPTPEHLIPRDRPVMSPSELSLALARSYGRYVCRTRGAASAEIVRHSRNPLSPLVLEQPDLPPGATDALIASYGEMTQ